MTDATEPPKMQSPQMVLGRSPLDPGAIPVQRAQVREVSSATFAYTTGAVGTAKVEVYKSVQDLDRGGMVLRLIIKDTEASFLPSAVQTPEGVDIHIAGEAEAEALVLALQTALMQLNADRARRVGVQVT